jgi:RNA polymerase primary sigma factor
MPGYPITTPWMRTTLLKPKLSADAERELLNRVKADDKKALEALMISQFKTVFHIAKRYQHMGFDMEDLIQEGFMGLLRAIKKFNPDRGVGLATYASYWVSVSISRALTGKAHLIRLPVHAQATLYQITKTIDLLSEELHRAPTDEELAERLGVDIFKMRSLKGAWRPAVSLDDEVVPGSESFWHEVIADPATVYDDNRDNDLAKIKRLKQLFSNPKLLDPNERAILCSRLGLDRGEPQSLEMLGQRFGVTRERIRQIQHMCLRRLRRYMMQSDNEFVEFLENCSEVSGTPRRKKLIDMTPPLSRSGWLYEAPQGKKRAPKWSALSKAQVPSGIKRRTRTRASSASAIEKQKGKVRK